MYKYNKCPPIQILHLNLQKFLQFYRTYPLEAISTMNTQIICTCKKFSIFSTSLLRMMKHNECPPTYIPNFNLLKFLHIFGTYPLKVYKYNKYPPNSILYLNQQNFLQFFRTYPLEAISTMNTQIICTCKKFSSFSTSLLRMMKHNECPPTYIPNFNLLKFLQVFRTYPLKVYKYNKCPPTQIVYLNLKNFYNFFVPAFSKQ